MSVSSQQIVRNFAPSWFAAVMGTGVLAWARDFSATATRHWIVARHCTGSTSRCPRTAPAWTLRWFHARRRRRGAGSSGCRQFRPHCSHRVLVLSVQFIQLDKSPEIALPLWWLGTVLAFVSAF